METLTKIVQRVRLGFNPASFARFPIREQTLFAKRLSFLVQAGVPVLESMHIIRDQMGTRGTRYVFDRIILDVSGGKYLSSGLERFRRLFGDFTINLIRVGESSGVLAQNLSYLAEELRKKEMLRRKVLGALVYPIFIVIATLGITALLTAYIFPKVLPIFSSLNVTLPITTRILIVVSGFLQSYGLIIVGALIAALIGITILHRRVPAARFFTDRVLLRLPIAGRISKSYNMANFCRTFGILLKSGMAVTDSLIVVGDTTRNMFYSRQCVAISKRVRGGEQISKYLSEHPKIYPPIMTHMIAVGERTGKLSDTLLYLSDLYESEVEDQTKNLSSVIEPALMVIMGLVVGFVAVSVITPIYEITKGLQR